MNKNIFMFLSVALVMLIPVPSRFAYGLVLLIEFVFLIVLGILFRALLAKIKIEEFQNSLVPVAMITSAIIFRQLLILISPQMAFTLGYILYLPPVSAYLLGLLADEKSASVYGDIKKNLRILISIFIPIIIVFIFRDLVGYGTLTLPSHNGLFVMHIIPQTADLHPVTVFFASIPGAFISLALCIFIINRFGLKWENRSAEKTDEAKKSENKISGSEKIEITENETEDKIKAESETVKENGTATDEKKGSAESINSESEKTVLKNPFDFSSDFSSDTPSISTNFSSSAAASDAPSLLNLQKLLEETDVD